MKSNRLTVCAFLSLACLIMGEARAAQVDAFWNPGTASWNLAANWTPAVIPNNGTNGNTYNVKIDNGNAAASNLSLNISPTIDNLTVDAGDMLTILNAQALILASGATAGAVNNAGTILIDSTGSGTYLRPATGPMTLTGGGILQMSDRTTNWIYKNAPGGSLINVDNTIQGAGNIGWSASPTAIQNHGTILANATNILLVDASAGVTNTAAMRAASGGTLRLSGGVFTNVGGLIEALDASVVQLNDAATIAGGTLSTTGTGLISVVGASSMLDGSTNTVTNSGHIRVNNLARLNLKGTVTNTGTIDVNSTGNNTYLQPEGPVLLTGGGVIQLSDSGVNWIYKLSPGGSLINVDNTIQGAGNIGWSGSPTAIQNQSTILANVTNILDVEASAGVVNTATMRAASGGTLRLSGGVFTNVGGLIEALDASVVQLNGTATIAGGTLSTTNTGLISVLGASSMLDGFTNTVTNNGHIRVNNLARLNLKGTVSNTGTIDVNSTGNNTYLQPEGPVMLTGGGVIQLSDSGTNWIYKLSPGGSLINVDNTIQGAGNIGWSGSPTVIDNQGTIIASGAQPLKLDPSAGITNSGTLQVTGAGGMQILTGSFTTSGNVTVNTTRVLTRTGAYIQTAGTTTVNGLIESSGALFSGGTLKGNGRYNPIAGHLINNGTIAPGDPIGTLQINGPLLRLEGTSVVSIEIGGLTPDTEHDVLQVVPGFTILGGTLRIDFVNGFDPQIGDSFVVMLYADQVGPPTNFEHFEVPCNLPGRAVQVDAGGGAVIVRIIAAADLVDVNCDCAYSMPVDVQALIKAIMDPIAFAAQFPTCPITNADFDNDGMVDGRDVQGFVDALLN